MSTKRKALSKKVRFEVFKRDGFKCMYCGSEAPKVLLRVDHIDPVAKGGANDLLNLITACQDCNAGKSDRELSDDTALAKQRAQLEELNDRREQLEMMLRWRQGLVELVDEQLEKAHEHFEATFEQFNVRSQGAEKLLRGYIKKFGLIAVMDAMDVAAEKYVVRDAEGAYDKESVNDAWRKVGGILHISIKSPSEQRLHYAKGILNKRLSWLPYGFIRWLRDAADAGVDVEAMVEEAKYTKNWNTYCAWLQARMGDGEG